MSPTLYHFSPATGVFVGTSLAAADPLELEAAREAVRRAIIAPARAAMDAAASAALSALSIANAAAGNDADARRTAEAAFAAALESPSAAFEAARIEADAAAAAVEPTIWLIPAHATLAAPPEIGASEQAKWTGAEWIIEPIEGGE